jgi:RNA 3'-terminal phosphate cyclase (ATP)|uniref:RNA 3'-terminal phosphate cyclase n=1 Tax=Desulfobacca acetoxidans TaxID=60893 RepID=A0A7C5EMH2_9BACT
MLCLDGSYGEGGGQIVRTSLSLAALLGEAVRITNIRAGREKPGLRAQHLTAVRAVAQVTGGELEGATLGSRDLTFRPRAPRGGNYVFDVGEVIGSAGSVTLVLQTLLPPLLAAREPTTMTLRGGTHVPWSPPVHYIMQVFLPALAELGGRVTLSLNRWGWYPRGGGEIKVTVAPASGFSGQQWLTPPEPAGFRGLSAGCRVPEHVIHRQARRLKERLGKDFPITEVTAEGLDPGSFVFIYGPRAGFHALGARGKPAEQVADEAAAAFDRFKARQAALDRHLADQVVLYLALARGPSAFTTEEVTRHLLTNIWVIEQFLGPTFTVQGNLGEPGLVSCSGHRRNPVPDHANSVLLDRRSAATYGNFSGNQKTG